MKTKAIFLLSAIFLMVACTPNEPSNISQSKYKILFKSESPYLDWYNNTLESFLSYHAKLNNDSIGENYEKASQTEDNTITLKNNIKIRVHDDYKLHRDEKQTILQVTRSANLLSSKFKAPQHTKDGEGAVTHTYYYTLQTALPINLIRPEIEPCNPIPMCYYDNFIIEWNADQTNENGVIIIAEWNGSTIYGPTQNISIANVDLVDDIGEAVLSTDLFEGMPDEALVDLWLIRANIITINGLDGEILLSDALENSPDVIPDLLSEYPELCIQLQPFMFGSGAIKQFSFFLIREL